MKSTAENSQFEPCVLCGVLTDIPVSLPIERRENYIVGCGQLCDDCAEKIHNTSKAG